MRIGILGAGGVGATVAGAVVKDKNAEIVLIARGETKENVLKRGWILESEVLGDQVIHPALVSDDPAEIGTVDVLVREWRFPHERNWKVLLCGHGAGGGADEWRYSSVLLPHGNRCAGYRKRYDADRLPIHLLPERCILLLISPFPAESELLASAHRFVLFVQEMV